MQTQSYNSASRLFIAGFFALSIASCGLSSPQATTQRGQDDQAEGADGAPTPMGDDGLRPGPDGVPDEISGVNQRPGPDGVPGAPSTQGVDWIAIPATEAWIGAQAKDRNGPRYDALAGEDDTEPRRVNLPAFQIMRTEMPVSVWRKCESEGKCAPRATTSGDEGEDTALRGITYAQAEQMCAFVHGRLPTGPEWEVASRADNNHRFAWGNGLICPVDPSEMVRREDLERARLSRCDDVSARIMRVFPDEERRHLGVALLLFTDTDWDASCSIWRPLSDDELRRAVLAKADALLAAAPTTTALPDCGKPRLNTVSAGPASIPYQLVYMSGNVAEWTSDAGPAEGGPLRAVRGGSFFSDSALEYRLAGRVFLPPDVALQDTGVRCARGG